MKLALLGAIAVISLSTLACSKHECSFKTDAEKQAFGTLADMTQGAFSCGVEGIAVGEDVIMMTHCDIGSNNCVPAMFAIHAKPETIKDVAAAYKAFLEKNQWKVEEKATSGKLGNGNPYEGVQLGAKNADKSLTVKISPMGDDMVEARTYLIAMK
jgi:hypothetical protein